MLAKAFYVCIGYLIGSISLPQIVARLAHGADLREIGTGTAGASNLSKLAPPLVVAAVGVGQMAQGALPSLIARHSGQPVSVQASAALASVAGQDWNMSLGFKGGRGMTHSIGVLAALAPETLPAIAATGLAGVATAQVPLAMIGGFALAPVVAAASGRPREVVRATEALLLLALAKRLEANRAPFPPGESKLRVLVRRLLHDRDVEDRRWWLGRRPAL